MATFTIINAEKINLVSFSLPFENARNTNQINLTLFEPKANDIISIDWGDGSSDENIPIGNFADISHNYGSNPISGNITISVPENLERVRTLGTRSLPFTYDLSELSILPNLENVFCQTNSSNIIGDITTINPTIKSVVIAGNSINGNLTNYVNTNLTGLNIAGDNIINGDISNTFPNLITLNIAGNNNITGDITNSFKELVQFILYGNNVITGNLSLYDNLENVDIRGNNELTGDLNNISSSVISFAVTGNNTYFGSLEDLCANINASSITIGGQANITGNIDNINSRLPSNGLSLTSPNINIQGNLSSFNAANTSTVIIENGQSSISGTFGEFTFNTLRIKNVVNNSVGGDISLYNIPSLQNTVLELQVSPINRNIDYSTSRNWDYSRDIDIILENNFNSSLTDQEVDLFLNDLNSSNYTKTFQSIISLTNGFSRTSNSDAAFNALDSAGVNITIN